MKITKLVVKNFKGITSLECDLYDRTLISGKNATGKTSVRDAIFWVLTDKMSDGSSATNIKPHDASGEPVHKLETLVDLTIEIDNGFLTIGKKVSEKWVKHRGETEATYDGDTTTYYINGNEKSAKDFKEICLRLFPEAAMTYGGNAHAFLNLDSKKRRTALLGMVSHEAEESLAHDPKWAEIVPELRFSTEEEMILTAKRNIKQHEERIGKEQGAIEVLERMIDEQPEPEEIESKMDDVMAEIRDSENKESDICLQLGELQDLNQELVEIDSQIVSEIKKANSERLSQREALMNKMLENRSNIANVEAQIAQEQATLTTLDRDFLEFSHKKTALQTETFDESKSICPVCGQKLPKKRIDAARLSFTEQHNANIEFLTGEIDRLMKLRAEKRTMIETLKSQLEILSKEGSSLTEQSLGVSDKEIEPTTETYAKLKQERSKIVKQINALMDKDLKSLASEANAQTKRLKVEYDELFVIWNKAKTKSSMQNEIEMHQQTIDEEREFIGDLYAKIDLVQQYQTEKINLLTDSVNSHFRVIKWEMFKTHKDGSTELCCEPLVGGTSYYRGLNHGDRLLAEIDVCQAFQKASGCEMFITIDDAESVDADRIPVLPNQTLVFRRTDDERLTITQI